jgi:hypothetical protein
MTAATVDVKALTDGDLFRRFSAAVYAIPAFSEADRRSADALWDDVRRYHDELAIPAQKHAALGGRFLSDDLSSPTGQTLERMAGRREADGASPADESEEIGNAHHKGGSHNGQYQRA